MALTCTSKSTGTASDYSEAVVTITGPAASGTFDIERNSLKLIGSTDEDDQHSRFNPMRVEFTIMIRDSNNAAMNAFIAELTSTSEEKYKCDVEIDGNDRFHGFINSQGSGWEDRASVSTRAFRIQASDGMSRLEAHVFGTSSYEAITPDTIEKTIGYCMSKIQTDSHYVILHSKVADGQTVSGNPMAHQRVDYGIWTRGDDPASPSLSTCKDVLEDIMVTYGLCLKYTGPYFLFYEPKLLATGGTGYEYTGAGTYSGTLAIGGSVAITNDKTLSTGDRGEGSGFSALGPYVKAHIKYDHGEQSVNMLEGLSYTGTNDTQFPDASLIEVGSVTVESGEVINLRFKGKLRTNSTAAPPTRWKNHRVHYRLRLRALNSSYDNYWRRHYDGFDFYSVDFSWYENPHWTLLGADYYDFITSIIDERNGDINIFTEVGFDTFRLDANYVNRIFFSWEIIRVFDENMNEVDEGDNPDIVNWEFSDLELVAVHDGNIVKRPTYTDYTAYGEENNSDFYTAITHIGDGPEKTSMGRLQMSSGGEWRDTVTWGGSKLLIKVVNEILGNREVSVGILSGTTYSLSYWFDKAFTYQGKTYLPMSTSYTHGDDAWEGKWVEFKVGSGSPVNKEAIVKSDEQVPIPKNPNRLPDDERLEERKREILTGTGAYQKDVTGITSVALKEPATYDYWKKFDKIDIIDPVIGYVDTLTLTDDVEAGDTSISIESWTPSEDFPPGSYLKINNKYANQRKRYYQQHLDFSGTDWTITVAALPDPAIVSYNEISLQLSVYKNGQKLMYEVNISTDDQYHKGYYLNTTGANNKIIFYESNTHSVIELIYDKG